MAEGQDPDQQRMSSLLAPGRLKPHAGETHQKLRRESSQVKYDIAAYSADPHRSRLEVFFFFFDGGGGGGI